MGSKWQNQNQSSEPAFITTMMAQSICEAEKKRKAYVKKPEEEAGGNQVAVIKRGRRKTNVCPAERRCAIH